MFPEHLVFFLHQQQHKMGLVVFFSYEQSFIKCILMIVLQHHHAIVHEHSYRLVHQQQKNPLHQQSCWWSFFSYEQSFIKCILMIVLQHRRWWGGFFCRSWTCFLGPFLNKIVGQEPHLLVHEQLYGIVPELAFISRCWTPPNSLADYLDWFPSFLVADARLYTLPCWSVGMSIRPSVRHIFWIPSRFSHYGSCPTICDWIAVNLALFFFPPSLLLFFLSFYHPFFSLFRCAIAPL